jgi:hypothetical protein
MRTSQFMSTINVIRSYLYNITKNEGIQVNNFLDSTCRCSGILFTFDSFLLSLAVLYYKENVSSFSPVRTRSILICQVLLCSSYTADSCITWDSPPCSVGAVNQATYITCRR